MKEKEIRELVAMQSELLMDLMRGRLEFDLSTTEIKMRNRIIDLSKRTEERLHKLEERFDEIEGRQLYKMERNEKQEPKTKTYVCEVCHPYPCKLETNIESGDPRECPYEYSRFSWRLQEDE